MSQVVVRFAPSPTGRMHLGGLRTALFNLLFARRHGGRFLLRIEDTDRTRYQAAAEADLVGSLAWAGLRADNGDAPMVQSRRTSEYQAAAARLLAGGHAYRCFCSPERVAAVRLAAGRAGGVPMYDRACRAVPASEAAARARAGEPHVLRLKVPGVADGGTTAVDDAVRGRVVFANATVDDQVLLKSDGMPTYHLANVVDDVAMGISHVLRGDEWLSSTPKHRMLYDALGWTPPVFAHLPLLLGENGAKLSKRNGDCSVAELRERGYLPEALTNFVAALGWAGLGDAPPLMSLDDMAARFDLRDLQRAPAVAATAKLNSVSAAVVRSRAARAPADLAGPAAAALRRRLAIATDAPLPPPPLGCARAAEDYLVHAVSLTAERAVTTESFGDLALFLYRPPAAADVAAAIAARPRAAALPLALWTAMRNELAALPAADADERDVTAAVRRAAEAAGVAPRDAMLPLRLILTGLEAGPLLPAVAALMGPQEAARRVDSWIAARE